MIPRILLIVAGMIMALAPSMAGAKKGGEVSFITALEAQQMLEQDGKNTFLVDVRTRAQYTLLGHPPKAYNIPWRFQTSDFQAKGGAYQGGKAKTTGYQLSAKPNPDFVGVMQSLFKPGDALIIISGHGKLGAEAAQALAQAGFNKVFCLRHGFSGDRLTGGKQEKLAEKLSPHHGLRGLINGWVFWGLPVSYQIDPRYIYPPDIKRMQTLK